MFRVVSRVKRDQSGSTILLVALAMVVLMGFAAFAVDIGNQYAHRREAQGAVDASVLAGAVESTLTGADEQTVVDEILSFVDTNLGETVAAAQWLNDCPDTTTPGDQLADSAADLGLTPATDCISWSRTGTEIRTALPTRQIETYFAGVVGVDELNVNGFAHANVSYSGVANPPPFVVTNGTSGGDEVCMRRGTGPTAFADVWVGGGSGVPATQTGGPDPCDQTVYNPDTQFYGTLKAYEYAPDPCGQPSGNPGIARVIAAGIDHTLGSFGDYSPGDPEKIDGAGCPSSPTPKLPNTMELQNGFTAQVLKIGLLSDAGPTGRLRLNNDQTTYTFAGQGFDNIPLWHYLRSNLGTANVPDQCRQAYDNRNAYIDTPAQWDYYDVKDLMMACLNLWSPGTHDPIFTDDPAVGRVLTTSSRFAWIPILDEGSLTGLDGGLVHINAFVPAFFNKLYQDEKYNAAGDPDASPFCWSTAGTGTNPDGWYTHEAGQQFSCARSNQNVDQLSAIVLDCRSLPDTVCVGGSTPSPGGQPVLEVELSK